MRIVNVRDYEGLYAVSDEGMVYNLKTGEEMKSTVIGGYKTVNLTKDGVKTMHRLNRLVFFSFNPRIPIVRRETAMAVDHINEDKLDNRLCNLRYITTRENVAGCSKKNDNGLPRGVNHLKSGKYAAGIQLDNKKYHLGVYDTTDEAGAAYKAALYAYEMYGEYPDTSATADRVKYAECLPQGVYINRRSGRFMAFAQLNGTRYYLGIYATVEEAASARQSAINNYADKGVLPIRNETKVKFCKFCNTEKPVSEFYYIKGHGTSWMCKECAKEYARQQRAKAKLNKENT